MQFDQLRRREFITLIGGAVAWPLAARAQQGSRGWHIGVLMNTANDAAGQTLLACFLSGLRELSWLDGKDFDMEIRWAEGLTERIPALAAELVSLHPDLIVVTGTPGAQAVQRATRQVPVVFIAVSDPVVSGIVASLARPGSNVTGVSNFLPATTGKLLELLMTVAPNTSRVGVLHNPGNAGKLLEIQELQTASRTLGVSIEVLEVRSPDDFDHAFSTISQSRCDALIALQDGVTLKNRSRIIEFAEKNRLPGMYQIREFVESGGLMSYGLDYCQHFRRAAAYVDKVLKGVRPADLPVELPTTFELIVNLKTAKAIGLTIPESFLLRADKVIE